MNSYDVIVIGAGSVGIPSAMSLAEKKLKVLVIDSCSSPGQENNKKSLGVNTNFLSPANHLADLS